MGRQMKDLMAWLAVAIPRPLTQLTDFSHKVLGLVTWLVQAYTAHTWQSQVY